MNGEPVKDAISVVGFGRVEGTRYVIVACVDFDAYKALPDAVYFEGRVYGRAGWDSDKGIACYQDTARVCYAVR